MRGDGSEVSLSILQHKLVKCLYYVQLGEYLGTIHLVDQLFDGPGGMRPPDRVPKKSEWPLKDRLTKHHKLKEENIWFV